MKIHMFEKFKSRKRTGEEATKLGAIGLAPVKEAESNHEAFKNLYTSHDIARILTGSINFSQREDILQTKLLAYIYNHNKDRITRDTVVTAYGLTKNAIAKRMQDARIHLTIGKNGDDPSILDQKIGKEAQIAIDMFLGVEGKESPDPGELARRIIQRDHQFVVRPGGRSRLGGDASNPAQNPYLSHFMYYGLQGNSTGIPEYNQMFKEAAQTFDQHKSDPEYQEAVQQMAEIEAVQRSIQVAREQAA